ncbi:hypothetical protein Q7P35_010736 [Cladosporium inversicolor]
MKLRSQCYPNNYWFAKHNLDLALELVAKCEQGPIPYKRDRTLAVLAERRQGVEAMLQERKKSYEEEWKAQSKDVPTESEWYEIVEGQAGDLDVVYAVEGSPLKGSDFPFKEKPGNGLIYVGRQDFATTSRACKVDATEATLQEQHGTEQDGQEWEEIDIMDVAMI